MEKRAVMLALASALGLSAAVAWASPVFQVVGPTQYNLPLPIPCGGPNLCPKPAEPEPNRIK